MPREASDSRSVTVFGAGSAGLSTAHELIRLGYRVSVYEAGPEAGGFFRSARHPDHDGMPSEYSWHGFGPWYHNAFDIMSQIPARGRPGSLYDHALSRPIDFGIFPDEECAEFYDTGLTSIPKMFRMSGGEWARWSWLMLKTWASNRRTEVAYARLNAAEQWRPQLRDRAYRAWRACFGPWIGSDWTKVSLHTTGQFFRKQLITQPSHPHRADEHGPAWSHGAGDGWLLAGSHTRTEADVWSIEGAVESGRRAARAIDPRVHVLGQYKPAWLKVLGWLDDACFALGAPHVLDLALATALVLASGAVAGLAWSWLG